MAASLFFLFACAQLADARHLFFITSSQESKTTVVRALDLDSSGYPPVEFFNYPFGPYNPGGGATGLCLMGNSLYWADQTTGTVHSAEIVNGNVSKHNPSYMSGLNDPQGVYCDETTNGVYALDNRDTAVIWFSVDGSSSKKLNISNPGEAGQLRGINAVGGKLWFAGDNGIFRTELDSTGAFQFKQVASGNIFEGIASDTTATEPQLFASTYDWSGEGVYTADLDSSFQTVSNLHVMPGSSCRRGTDMPWGLAADASSKQLFWVLNADDGSMQLMAQRYDGSATARAVYKGTQQGGYGLVVDSAAREHRVFV